MWMVYYSPQEECPSVAIVRMAPGFDMQDYGDRYDVKYGPFRGRGEAMTWADKIENEIDHAIRTGGRFPR